MDLVKIILLLFFLFISGILSFYGLIYYRQVSKVERETAIFLPSSIKVFLYLWLVLGVTTVFLTIGGIVLSILMLDQY